MGRVIELNGTPFAREGSTRPQHVDPKHEQYGPETMLHAIQGGMYALQAADKLTAPLVKRLHGALEPELPENRTDEFGLKKTGAGGRGEEGGHRATVRGDEEGLWCHGYPGEQCGRL